MRLDTCLKEGEERTWAHEQVGPNLTRLDIPGRTWTQVNMTRPGINPLLTLCVCVSDLHIWLEGGRPSRRPSPQQEAVSGRCVSDQPCHSV